MRRRGARPQPRRRAGHEHRHPGRGQPRLEAGARAPRTRRRGGRRTLLDSYEAERRQVALGVVSTAHRLTRLATVRSPVARRLRNALLAVAGLTGPLPRRLAANLAEVDIVYRGGWSADGSNAVGRWIPEGGMAAAENQDTASGPAFGLVVPEVHEAQVLDAAARFPGLAVRVVPVPGVAEASLVRPDGYVAGRGGAGDGARLLGLLAQALGITPHGPGAGAAVTSGRAQLPHPSGRQSTSRSSCRGASSSESWKRRQVRVRPHRPGKGVLVRHQERPRRRDRSVRPVGPTEPGRPSLTSFERGTILSGSSSKRPPRRRYAATTRTIASPCQPAGGWAG